MDKENNPKERIMKNNRFKPVAFSINLLLASVLLASGFNAEAKSVWRKIKHTANSASDTVAQSADTIASSSQNELSSAASTAQSSYASTAQAANKGYNDSVKALSAVMNDALYQAYKAAGNKMLNNNRDKTVRIANSFRNLDDDGLNALNRIIDAISKQRIDDSLKNDMVMIAKKLSLLENGTNLPNGLANSNFGISLDNTAGLIVGVGQSIGIGMDLSPSNGYYKFAIVQGQSISSGLQADITTGVSVFWSPGSIQESGGASVGLALELALEGGAGVGVSWGVGADITKISPVPGLSLAFVGGASIKADLVGGYGSVVQKIQMPVVSTSNNSVKPKDSTVGGGGGTAWDDSGICVDAPISAFRLLYNGSIDAVQFGYKNRGWAPVHGYQTSKFTVEVVGLPSDELFTEVHVGAGSRVDNLTFYTNKGRKFGPYGGGQSNGSFKAESGGSIGCMAGRSGSSVDQLTFRATGPR